MNDLQYAIGVDLETSKQRNDFLILSPHLCMILSTATYKTTKENPTIPKISPPNLNIIPLPKSSQPILQLSPCSAIPYPPIPPSYPLNINNFASTSKTPSSSSKASIHPIHPDPTPHTHSQSCKSHRPRIPRGNRNS